MHLRYLIVLVMAMFVARVSVHAQINVEEENGLYRIGGIVVGADTFGYIFLNNVDVVGKMPRHIARERRRQQGRNDELARLRYRVRKTYPYAVTAAYLLKDVDAELQKLDGDKKARRQYLNKLDAQLNKRFKGELEEFSVQEGVVLVKLINRQTGKNCFSIIKELKGGFSATIWQTVALLFENNLKREYDPNGRDRDIEMLVQELERDAGLRAMNK